MGELLIESSIKAAWKLMTALYILCSAFGGALSEVGFNIWFLYIGLAGQIIATLVEIEQITSKENYTFKFRAGAFISTIAQWIIGPVLALLLTSALFTDVSAVSGITAFGIGAFWELAWKYLKKKTKDTLGDIDNDEDRPGGGPR